MDFSPPVTQLSGFFIYLVHDIDRLFSFVMIDCCRMLCRRNVGVSHGNLGPTKSI